MIAKHSTNGLSDQTCPICRASDTLEVCELAGMPVHVGRHWPTAEAARSCPRGDIRLRFCRECGMLWNSAFDPALINYDAVHDDGEYDNSLYFSAVHRELARRAAARLIEQHAIRGKDIIEIGCGTGEFLTTLCELGNNRGVGFDPSYRPGDTPPADIRFVRELYGPEHADYRADLICSRYVLEHVADPVSVLKQLHRNLQQQDDALVYFEVPNAWLVFDDGLVWDLIYEHFSNFCRSSLVRTFEEAGFAASEVGEACDGQVLWIEARPRPTAGEDPVPTAGEDSVPTAGEDPVPTAGEDPVPTAGEDPVPTAGEDPVRHTETPAPSKWDDRTRLEPAAGRLRDETRRLVDTWQRRLAEFRREGREVVMWGAGAKGISFLNLLDVRDQIPYVVDINPRKCGRFMPCTGQEIVSPQALNSIRPDTVLVMNPIYESEIEQMIRQQSLTAEVICV